MTPQPTFQEQLNVSSPLGGFDTNSMLTTNITSGAAIVSSELSPSLSSSSSLSMAMNPMTAVAASSSEGNYLVDYNLSQIPISLAGVPLPDPTMAQSYPTLSMPLDSPIATAFSTIGTTEQPMAAQLNLPTGVVNPSSGTPPTPVSTPTVPSLSKQASLSGVKLPEFHEYSRLQYEISTNPEAKKRVKQQDDVPDRSAVTPNAELRRQIHIQSEQKRRAQIKDGFEELRRYLPSCGGNKKVSKSAILNKTVVFIQQLKNNQITLLAELERLNAENDRLKQCVFGPQNGQH